MSNNTHANIVECPICQFHYVATREHCPTCGTIASIDGWPKNHCIESDDKTKYYQIVVARGAERARQLPQSPRFFELVD